MIRGDTKEFKFKIKSGETYIDGSTYDEVELQFNPQLSVCQLKKLKSKGEIEWNATANCFVSHLSQEDTFLLNDGNVSVQVRLFKNNKCKATLISSVDIGKVLSKEVIGEHNG